MLKGRHTNVLGSTESQNGGWGGGGFPALTFNLGPGTTRQGLAEEGKSATQSSLCKVKQTSESWGLKQRLFWGKFLELRFKAVAV